LRWVLVFALAIMVGLAAMVTAGVLGLRQGQADRAVALQARAAAAYQQGVAYLDAGEVALAAQQFQTVLSMDPGNREALQQLQALQALPTATPTPSPLLEPVLVAPDTDEGGDSGPSPQELLFAQAEQAVQNTQWSLAAGLLDQLVALDSTYRPDEVEALRFDLAYGQGMELVGQGHYEQSLRAFDQALDLRPGDVQAKRQRDLAALYVSALGAWRVDWPRVVSSLETILTREPGYQDVSRRLALAQEGWADDLFRDGSWCRAAERYEIALKATASKELRDKQKLANEFCLNPPTPTPTPPVEETVAAAGGLDLGPAGGHIAFASYSTDLNRWIIFRVAASGDARPEALVEGASQPALSPSGGQLALHAERTDMGGLGLTSVGQGAWQRITTYTEDSHPQWSPNGQALVFDSTREGDRLSRVYLTGAGPGDGVSLGLGRWPTWSADGNTIVYQACDETGNRCGLWLMGIDGTARRPLTQVAGDAMPSWSPDGSRVAFASPDRSGNWDVFVVDVASGAVTVQAASPGIDSHPVWSPDGTQVAVLTNRDGSWAIAVVEVASGQVSGKVVLPGTQPDWFNAQISWAR
jgi:tetratricopeptide (TPR) repeat protein